MTVTPCRLNGFLNTSGGDTLAPILCRPSPPLADGFEQEATGDTDPPETEDGGEGSRPSLA